MKKTVVFLVIFFSVFSFFTTAIATDELKEITIESEKKGGLNWLLIIFWLIIPAIGILIVSMINQLRKIGDKKLLVFYCAVLAAIIAGLLIGISIHAFVGMLADVFVSILASESTGKLAGGLAGGFMGVFASGFAGGLTGWLAGSQDYKIILPYLIFIAVVMLVSFLIAKIAHSLKNHFTVSVTAE